MLHAIFLLCFSPWVLSSEVDYRHPNLTIVAKDEPLDAVLRLLGREMRIFVTIPSGLNPVVSCDARNQPVKQALKCLLGEMSYSLEWEDDGERLVGLTIFSSDAQSTAGAGPARAGSYPTGVESVTQSRDAVVGREPPIPAISGSGGPVSPAADADAMGRSAGSDAAAEHEARMAEEREAHEAEMALRRQEEEVAQRERMEEQAARQEAEMRAYIESQGLPYPD